jgi:hypothetical protein
MQEGPIDFVFFLLHPGKIQLALSRFSRRIPNTGLTWFLELSINGPRNEVRRRRCGSCAFEIHFII